MTEQEYWYTRYAEEQQYREAEHKARMAGIEKRYSFYQLCPKCDGEGTIKQQEFGHNYTVSVSTITCPVCNGAKLLVRPEIKNDNV